jgi:hypothetical protein
MKDCESPGRVEKTLEKTAGQMACEGHRRPTVSRAASHSPSRCSINSKLTLPSSISWSGLGSADTVKLVTGEDCYDSWACGGTLRRDVAR